MIIIFGLFWIFVLKYIVNKKTSVPILSLVIFNNVLSQISLVPFYFFSFSGLVSQRYTFSTPQRSKIRMGHTTRKHSDFFGTYVTQWMGYKRFVLKSGQIAYYICLQVTDEGLYQVLSKKTKD